MKRLTVYNVYQFTVFSLMFFLCMNCVQAAQVGCPASLLKKGQWDFAIEGGYINERPMETDGNANYHVDIGYGYHSRSYGLTERLTITGKVGGSYGYLYDEATTGAGSKTSLSGGLVLGAQLKGIIFENKEQGFEWDGSSQFLYMCSHHKRSGKANVDWYEWQLATCLAKAFNRLKPYAGVKFTTVNLDHDDGKGNKTSYDEDGSVAPFVGTDIYFGDDRDIVVNLEGAFLIGNEIYIGVKYRF